MKTFVDCNGKTWEIVINLGAVKRIEDTLGVNILDDSQLYGGEGENSESFAFKIATDIVFTMDVVKSVCAKSIENNGYASLGDVEIYDLFDGDVVNKARTAFLEELSDFFLKVGKPKAMETIEIWRKTMETSFEKALLAAEMSARASEEWNKNAKSYLESGEMDKEKETKLLEELLQSGTSFGDGLES